MAKLSSEGFTNGGIHMLAFGAPPRNMNSMSGAASEGSVFMKATNPPGRSVLGPVPNSQARAIAGAMRPTRVRCWKCPGSSIPSRSNALIAGSTAEC